MNTSESTRTAPDPGPPCPRCGRAIPADAVGSACPSCLIAAGFFTQTAAPGQDEPPPAIAELAPEFPALELLELLGRGGMGAVYKARQRDLDRLVALKILRPGLDVDPTFAARFTDEARALARLNHPGIVTLHEFGRTPAGRYFIVMEFVDGMNLRQLLSAGRIAPREALAIVPPLCDALQYAHDRGLVHRDIKPENILLDRLGRVKIADFGLARLATAPAEPSEEIMGTPAYMAPEQRDHPGAVDHRADIYALGVVLYQMLTGELPAPGELHPPSHRVRIDVRLDDIVLRALERNPERRYAAAGELKTELETVASSASPTSAPANDAGSPAVSRASPLLPWLGALSLFVAFAALVFATVDMMPARIASHFDGDGRPDGWMSRTGYLRFTVAIPFGLAALFAFIAWSFRRMPVRFVNLPHREHWLAPERKTATAAILARWMAAPAALLAVLFAELHLATLFANQLTPPRISSGLLVAATTGALTATIVWLAGFVLRFSEPDAAPRKLRRQSLALAAAAALAVLLPAAPFVDEWHDMPAKRRRSHADSAPVAEAAIAPPTNPRFSLKLPNGGYVELVGVSTQPSTRVSWWTPDGAPIPAADWRALYPATWPVSNEHDESYDKSRQFVFHADGPGAPPRILDVKFFDSAETRAPFAASLVVQRFGAPASAMPADERWSGFLMPLAAPSSSGRVQALVADGPLSRLVDLDLRGSNHSFHARHDGRRFIVGGVYSHEGKAAVQLTADLGGEFEWRLRADDSAGRLHTPRIIAGGSNRDLLQETLVFDDLRPADVALLSLWIRPAHWVDFADVSLLAGQITSPTIRLLTEASSTQTVTVQGAVARPGAYPLRPDATLIDAIAAAGGWISGGDQSAVLVTAPGSERPEVHDLGAILNGEAINPGLAAGAIIVVPNRNR